MKEAVPPGIVTNTQGVASEIESIDHVEYEDIMRLWRTFTISKVAHESGGRLSNLFWRILGTRSLYENIRGSTIARLFSRILEDKMVRTTPTQSSHSARRYSATKEIVPPPHFEIPPDVVPSSSGEDAEKAIQVVADPSRTTVPAKSSLPLPPILKKPRTGSGDVPLKTARIVAPVVEEGHRHGTRNDVVHTSPRKEKESSKIKGKKPAFVATSTANRRRPAMLRKRTLHGSSANLFTTKVSPKLLQQPTQSASLTESEQELSSNANAIANSVETSDLAESRDEDVQPIREASGHGKPFSVIPFYVPPPKSKASLPLDDAIASGKFVEPDLYIEEDVSPSRQPRDSLPEQATEPELQSTAPLVDRDFRSKFAEKRAMSAAQLPKLSDFSMGIAESNTGGGTPNEEALKKKDNVRAIVPLPRTQSLLTMAFRAGKLSHEEENKPVRRESGRGNEKRSHKGKERAT